MEDAGRVVWLVRHPLTNVLAQAKWHITGSHTDQVTKEQLDRYTPSQPFPSSSAARHRMCIPTTDSRLYAAGITVVTCGAWRWVRSYLVNRNFRFHLRMWWDHTYTWLQRVAKKPTLVRYTILL
jgi:hypothetical protein